MSDDINKKNQENINYSSDSGDYYNQLKSESYKAMLDSQVQASVARDQALKYTNNSLAQSGYANQGLAQSTQAGIANQYQSALSQAGQTYQTNLNTINQQMRSEAQTEQSNKASQLETLLSSAQDETQLNNTLKAYLGDADDNGEYDYSSLGSSANYIKALQDIYRQGYNTVSEPTGTAYSSASELKQLTTTAGYIASSTTKGQGVSNEIDYITTPSYMNNCSNGKVVCLINGSNSNSALYLQFYDGKWYQSDANAYRNATDKEEIAGK